MFKLIALVFAAILAVVAAKPGYLNTVGPAINTYSYSTYQAPLTYSASGYYPLAYNGYSGILGYSQQYGYNYARPYNYYI